MTGIAQSPVFQGSRTRQSDPAEAIPMSRFRLIYQGEDPATVYTGSAWRGTMGHALKKLVCIARGQACPSCFVYRSCVYTYIFETPPPEDTERMRLYPAAPHPFVLYAGASETPGQCAVHLTLFGKAGGYLAYLLHAMRSAGEIQKRGEAKLLRVEQEVRAGGGEWELVHVPGGSVKPFGPTAVPVPPAPKLAGVSFESPLRLRQDERYVGAGRMTLPDLLRSVVRRISALAYFHADTELEADFRELRESAKRQSWMRSQLRWQDQERYSSRQGRKVPIGGVRGVALVDATELGNLWPYLWLGQYTLAGKGTSLGLGQYRVRPMDGEA